MLLTKVPQGVSLGVLPRGSPWFSQIMILTPCSSAISAKVIPDVSHSLLIPLTTSRYLQNNMNLYKHLKNVMIHTFQECFNEVIFKMSHEEDISVDAVYPSQDPPFATPA